METVPVIPNTAASFSLGETRNISCTPIFSRILEFFFQHRLREEVTIKTNQYGSTAGVGTSHYLAEVWNDITGRIRPGAAVLAVSYLLI